jgi:hypothetical protein
MEKSLMIFTFILFFMMGGGYSQSPAVKTTAVPLKKIICKNWKVKSYESFGVERDPDSLQIINGKLVFGADSSVKITNIEKTINGKWFSDSKNTFLTMVYDTKEKKVFKIISYSDTLFVIQYQTPDLIRTNYNLVTE